MARIPRTVPEPRRGHVQLSPPVSHPGDTAPAPRPAGRRSRAWAWAAFGHKADVRGPDPGPSPGGLGEKPSALHMPWALCSGLLANVGLHGDLRPELS